ncbi:hypothetical protein PVAP13_1KG050708 [Panicum virgatum]|uniref:Uncharacterized protein n=1 Tax=Panicum virgatum TaxID=38727 RepID=A0A8T0XBG1_PANVG|nr:hypothetical protein PVAP13_1KG050708 [Panicum virgatum]
MTVDGCTSKLPRSSRPSRSGTTYHTRRWISCKISIACSWFLAGASLQDNKKSFLRSYGYWLCFPLAAMGFMVNGSKWWVIHTVLSSLQEKVGN